MSDDLKERVQAIIERHPRLTAFGMGVFDEQRLSPAEREEKFAEDRAEMFSPESLRMFAVASRWLGQFKQIKGFNNNVTSYGLKHTAEPLLGYTYNGMFIAGAVDAGFHIRLASPGSSNVVFNISERSRTAVERRRIER